MQGLQKVFRQSPGVMTMMAIQIITFLMIWSGGTATALVDGLTLSPASALAQPWQLFTHTFVGSLSLLNVAFGCMWLWFAGRPVEEELGTRNWWLAVLGFATVTNVFLLVGALALRSGGPSVIAVTGFAVVNAILTCLWAARRPLSTILFFGVIPVQLRWIALLSVALIIFSAGISAPLAGFLAAVPLLVAWLWAGGKLPVAYPAGGGGGSAAASSFAERKLRERQSAEFEDFRANVKQREKEREERERLKRLFEDLSDDDPKR